MPNTARKMTLDNKIDHFMTHADGFSNGMYMGYDFLGALYTTYSGKSTIGGFFANDMGRRMEDVDYDSRLYEVSKGVGLLGGFCLNYLLYGIPQGIALVVNVLRARRTR